MLRTIGKGDFALFGGAHHAVAQTLTPHFIEQRDLLRILRITHQIVEETAIRGAVKITLRRDVVDGNRVPPRQDRQGDAFLGLSAHAEQRHQALERQGDIQIVTAHAAAAVPQQTVFTIATVMPLRTHQQQRTVRCTAADVHHQHPFLFRQRGFKIQPCRHRLILKHHVTEASAVCCTLKDPLRLLVGFVAAQPLEVDRTANHCLSDSLRHLRLRLIADMQHHRADQILKHRHLLRLQAAGAEEGFRGFYEVNLFRVFNVLPERREAELHAGRRNLNIFFTVETDRSAQQRLGLPRRGRNLMVAEQPLAHRFARGRTEH